VPAGTLYWRFVTPVPSELEAAMNEKAIYCIP
jgi:hypothetical protein